MTEHIRGNGEKHAKLRKPIDKIKLKIQFAYTETHFEIDARFFFSLVHFSVLSDFTVMLRLLLTSHRRVANNFRGSWNHTHAENKSKQRQQTSTTLRLKWIDYLYFIVCFFGNSLCWKCDAQDNKETINHLHTDSFERRTLARALTRVAILIGFDLSLSAFGSVASWLTGSPRTICE